MTDMIDPSGLDDPDSPIPRINVIDVLAKFDGVGAQRRGAAKNRVQAFGMSNTRHSSCAKRLIYCVCLTILLSACAYIRPLPPLAYRLCPVEQSAWVRIDAPKFAPVLLAMISDQSRPRLRTRDDRIYWFKNENKLTLCSTRVTSEPQHGCGARIWDFENVKGEWILVSDLETVLVCG